MRSLISFPIIALLLLLSGCSSTDNTSSLVYQNADNQTQTKLAEAAVSVSNSLSELAAIEKANNPQTKLTAPPNPASIGMAQTASVDWTGPIEPLVAKLAHTCNYKLKVLGKRPAIPVIVSVYHTNVTVADILRDISYQSVKKADVLIYPSRRIIELRYLNS